jgi:hypothetical protein
LRLVSRQRHRSRVGAVDSSLAAEIDESEHL